MRGLKYVSPADTTGYAVAAKAYLRALLSAGVPVQWVPLRCPGARYLPVPAHEVKERDLQVIAHRPVTYDTVLLHSVPEYYPEWIARERKSGRRILGYTVWELEHLPKHWPALLNQLDAVIVPCQWNVRVFRRSGVHVPIHVVPHLSQFGRGSDTPADREALLARIGGGEPWHDRFVFYTIGYWTARKGTETVLRTYLETFSSDDPVALVIKTSARDYTRWRRPWRSAFRRCHPRPSHTAAELAAGHPFPPSWYVIDEENLTEGEMRALHGLGNAFVSLTRTEGWGLGAFDAALAGRPVVMTGYGGQTDFLPPDLACLVGYQMVPAHEPLWAKSYSERDQWAAPNTRQAGQWMRALANDPAAAHARGAALGDYVRGRFSEEQTVAALCQSLDSHA